MVEDKTLKDLPVVKSIGYNDFIPITQSSGSENMNIPFKSFVETGKLTHRFDIAAGQEIEIYGSEYGMYQLDDYSSGWIALYIISHYDTKVIASIGTFGTNPDFDGLSLYKKTPNGPLFCKNRAGVGHVIGFKRL